VIALPSLTDDEEKLLGLYYDILKVIPGLESKARYTLENRYSRLVDLATFVHFLDLCTLISHSFMSKIKAAGHKGRSDNCTSLCNDALDYIPRIKDVPNIE